MSELPSKTQLTLEGEGGMGGELYFEHASDSFAVNLNGQLMFLSLEDAGRLRDYLSARLSHEPPLEQRPLSATQRLHNICDALSEQMDESAFSREEWDRVDRQTVDLQNRNRELEAEVSSLREHLAEVNRLMSLNVAALEKLQSAQLQVAPHLREPPHCSTCACGLQVCDVCEATEGRHHSDCILVSPRPAQPPEVSRDAERYAVVRDQVSVSNGHFRLFALDPYQLADGPDIRGSHRLNAAIDAFLIDRATATKSPAPAEQLCPCDSPYREGYECMYGSLQPHIKCRRLAAVERCSVCQRALPHHMAGCSALGESGE